MANSFEFNSVDLGDSDHNLTLVKPSETTLFPPIKLDKQPRGGGHGSVVQDALYGERLIRLTCKVAGSSAANFRTLLDNIASALDPSNGEKLLILDHETGLSSALNRGYYATLDAEASKANIGVLAAQFELHFVASWPFAVTVTAQGQSETAVDANPKTLYEPTGAEAVVLGTRRARPVWTFKNTHATTLTTITIANTTRSETAVVVVSIPQNNYMRIDTERRAVQKSSDGTTWTNAMSGFTSSQDWLYLTHAVRNTITVTGAVAGELTVAYRGEYI